jgi:hypothetical protein
VQSRFAGTIEAEIAHLCSLRLDGLRRHWRVIFGRTPPADLGKDLLKRMIAHRPQQRGRIPRVAVLMAMVRERELAASGEIPLDYMLRIMRDQAAARSVHLWLGMGVGSLTLEISARHLSNRALITTAVIGPLELPG